MNANRHITGIALAIAGSLLSTASAGYAGPGRDMVQHNADGTRSVRVSYADLNLATQAGRAALDGRLDRAYKMVCSTPHRGPMDRYDRGCRRTAVASVQLNVARAIGIHTGRQLALADTRR